MTDKQTGGSAFPHPTGGWDNKQNGMTLRDYFAAKAMQGRLAGAGKIPAEADIDFDMLAKQTYDFADAMLKAREQ